MCYKYFHGPDIVHEYSISWKCRHLFNEALTSQEPTYMYMYMYCILKPFSHDEKNQHSLRNFLNVCEILQNELRVKRTVMFYMSYIPCEIFANIEKFCRRSGPTTKSYASVIFRTEPCSLPRVKRSLFIDRRSMRKRSYRARVMTLRARPLV